MTAISIGSQRQDQIASDLQLATSRAWVEVNRAALHRNIAALRALIPPDTQFWAVVKANAYGHGAVLIATEAIAAGATGVCVATLAEGIELRRADLQAPILILGALNTKFEVAEALRWHLDITLTDTNQIPLYREVAAISSQRVPLHLNVDTGMSRLGVPWQSAAQIWQTLTHSPEFECLSLYSHLATADHLDPTTRLGQEDRFAQVIQDLKQLGLPLPHLHLDNSAGALVSQAGHYHQVRLGLAMYGLDPAPQVDTGHDLKHVIEPVLTVKARVTHLQTVPAGTGVSYGHRYVTSTPTQIATVGIGYADGIPLRLSGWLTGQLRGQVVHQVGMITMDQCMWDVTDIPDLEVGDVLELLGSHASVDDWATYLGTIPYEILCGFSARLPRIAVC